MSSAVDFVMTRGCLCLPFDFAEGGGSDRTWETCPGTNAGASARRPWASKPSCAGVLGASCVLVNCPPNRRPDPTSTLVGPATLFLPAPPLRAPLLPHPLPRPRSDAAFSRLASFAFAFVSTLFVIAFTFCAFVFPPPPRLLFPCRRLFRDCDCDCEGCAADVDVNAPVPSTGVGGG